MKRELQVTAMTTQWQRDQRGQVTIKPAPPRMVTYPYPMRGELIYLTLPIDLTAADAARLTDFLAAVAFLEEEESQDA